MLQRTAHRTMQASLSSLIRRQNSDTLLPMSTDPNPTSLLALLLTVYFLVAFYAIGVMCTSPQWVERPGLEADHTPPLCVKVKNEWSYASPPHISLHDVHSQF